MPCLDYSFDCFRYARQPLCVLIFDNSVRRRSCPSNWRPAGAERLYRVQSVCRAGLNQSERGARERASKPFSKPEEQRILAPKHRVPRFDATVSGCGSGREKDIEKFSEDLEDWALLQLRAAATISSCPCDPGQPQREEVHAAKVESHLNWRMKHEGMRSQFIE